MFLNPFLLFGLSAVSVPIIIHLLNRRKFERVVWAAMRFIQISVQQNQRRMQIEDLILLALRCLLLALLAIALARPALQSATSVFGQSRVTAVIILDNSYSMGMTDGQQSRFDQGRKIADQILNAFPGGSSTALLLASDVVQEVIPEPTSDLNFAREKIHQVALCDRGTNMFPAIQKALKILDGRPGIRKEIYVITDGQASGWKQTGDIAKMMDDARKDVGSHVIIVGEPATRNVGVSDLRMASALSPVNQSLRFEVQVTNYGQAEVREIPVRLSIDNDPPSEETTIDVIEPNVSKSISLFTKLRTPGLHTITARIPHDQLPADDQRSLVVRAINTVQVLLVDGNPGREDRESETYFLRAALQPVDPLMREKFFIQTRVCQPGDLETMHLDEYDAIVLANVADVPPPVVKGLEKFVKDGRGLVIFPGGNTNLTFYNEQLYKARQLLPVPLGEAHGDPNQEKFVTLQTKNYEHPIVSLWNDPGAGNLGAVKFYRMFDLLVPAASDPKMTDAKKTADVGPTNVVIRFSDGKPAIVERTLGLGRVILFASAATTNAQWNDLAVRPKIFIPLVHRVIGSLLERQDDYLNLKVGQKLVLRTSSDLLGRSALISRPGDTGKVQEPRPVDLDKVTGLPTLVYDRTDLGGVYTVTFAGDTVNTVKFATQPDAEESRLEAVSKDQMDTLSNAATVVRWKPGMVLEDKLQQDRIGREIWLYFAIAVVILATAETFLAHWFSHPK